MATVLLLLQRNPLIVRRQESAGIIYYLTEDADDTAHGV